MPKGSPVYTDFKYGFGILYFIKIKLGEGFKVGSFLFCFFLNILLFWAHVEIWGFKGVVMRSNWELSISLKKSYYEVVFPVDNF